jgi:hypothetical protein
LKTAARIALECPKKNGHAKTFGLSRRCAAEIFRGAEMFGRSRVALSRNIAARDAILKAVAKFIAN